MKKVLFSLFIFCLTVFLSVQSVHAATATLKLDDGISPVVTILDNSVIPFRVDTDPRLGVVNWSGTVGIFNLNVVTGTTKTFLTGLPEIDLFGVSANTMTGPGSIDVWFSETGFIGIGSPGTVTTTVGGTTDDTVEFFSYIDNTNTLFGMGTSTGTLGPYVDAFDPPGDPPFGFSGATNSTVAISTPFSITGYATITHGSAGDLTSFDMSVKVVPEPISSTLFIVGGATLVLRRYWKKRKTV